MDVNVIKTLISSCIVVTIDKAMALKSSYQVQF